MRVGIDIGGTHTDAVALDGEKIVASTKTLTTEDIVTGFTNALNQLGVTPSEVVVGTTHATNAILQRKGLNRVGVIRLAGHKPTSLPACFGWPEDLKRTVLAGVVTVDGGFNCDGKVITPFNPAQIKQAAAKLMAMGAETIAIVGVFSPLNPSQELEAASYIDLPFTLSHQIGGMGIVERENGAILNCALMSVIKEGFEDLESRVNCRVSITQNNGSMVNLQDALKFPILTLSAGPTNSFVGGAKLAALKDAIVIDVGGTSTDVGVVRNGYPRRCLQQSAIGGVTISGTLPDVQSIALGGGSHVIDGTIGPQSCGCRLRLESIAFGGDVLTMTDIALALGIAEIPGADKVSLSHSFCQRVMENAGGMVRTLIQKIAIEEEELPIVMIGGGAILFEGFHKPEYSGVANAYGAAMAEVSAAIDTVVSLNDRRATLDALTEQAFCRAKEKGADEKRLKLVDLQVIPYNYVPGNMARVVAVVSGPIVQEY